MDRRRFLLTSLAGALAVPVAAEGQQPRWAGAIEGGCHPCCGFVSGCGSQEGDYVGAYRHGGREPPGRARTRPEPGTPRGQSRGVAFNSADLAGKRLDLLRELVPTLRRGAVLTYSAHPNTAVRSAESARRHRSPHPGRPVNRLQTFASQSVLAIQNARLFTEKVRRLVAAEEKPLTVRTVAVA